MQGHGNFVKGSSQAKDLTVSVERNGACFIAENRDTRGCINGSKIESSLSVLLYKAWVLEKKKIKDYFKDLE